MIKTHYTKIQPCLPGLETYLPGWEIRATLRVMALSAINGWRHLERFAADHLTKGKVIYER